MRNNFADEVCKLAEDHQDVVLLSGDIGNRLFDNLKAVCPERFFNCGIAEQSMMGIASGLALSGFRPIVYTITPFTTYRCFEQIRVDVCYQKVPVIIVGTGSGLSYASLGPTHHSMEDMAVLRTLPEMTVFSPCDPLQVRKGLRAAYEHDGPVYIRLGKKGEPVLDNENDVILGRSVQMMEGSDICIVATGSVLSLALNAANSLKNENISARVENFHTIKPLDREKLNELADKFETLVVVEEHGIIGGLYGAIAEYYIEKNSRPRVIGIGAQDTFLHEIGGQNFARKFYGITEENIINKCKQLF